MLTECCGMQLRTASLVVGWISILLEAAFFLGCAIELYLIDFLVERNAKEYPDYSKEQIKECTVIIYEKT